MTEMRTVSYAVLGGVGGSFEERGTVADLLQTIPYLLTPRIVPPHHVINELLAKGTVDAGMSGGCKWEPFQITQSEWEAIAQHLKTLPEGEACEFVQPPDWVITADDWHAWIMIFKYGYPDEFRELELEVRHLEGALKQAIDEGNSALVEELHLRVIEVGEKIARIAMAANERRER